MRYHTVSLTLALSAVAAGSLAAQAPMRVAPSGRALTEVTLTLADSAARAAAKPSVIRIDYGQPHLRGRKLLTDSLVPYDELWRTGANDPTTLTTDVDLVIGGASVPKGKYFIETLPSRSAWWLIILKKESEGGDAPRDPANELARINLRRTTLPTPVESFTIWLIPSRERGQPHGELRLAWGNIALATDWSVR